MNPCAQIMATNGRVLLFGFWDAAPELTLTLDDLLVGTAGLEKLKSHCSGQVLEKIAREISEQLRVANVVYPFAGQIGAGYRTRRGTPWRLESVARVLKRECPVDGARVQTRVLA